MPKAVLSLMAGFYLVDIDYPEDWEIAFTILQILVFQDSKSPVNIIETVNNQLKSYKDFLAN